VIINPLTLQMTETSPSSAVDKAGSESAEAADAAKRDAAQAFETAFIAQMLTFSGLDKALTLGGGEEMSAFTSFYIESLAQDISDGGGFGLADNFYKQLVRAEGSWKTLNVQ